MPSPSPGDMVVYDSIMHSNLSQPEKSAMRRWFERNVGSVASIRPREQGSALMETFRQTAEGGLTTIALASLHVMREDGLDVKGVGIDATISGLASLAAVGMGSSNGFSTTARNIGVTAGNLWLWRMWTNFLIQRKLASGETLPRHLNPGAARMSGDPTEDPIVAVGAKL